jgi:hypothetical protein
MIIETEGVHCKKVVFQIECYLKLYASVKNKITHTKVLVIYN